MNRKQSGSKGGRATLSRHGYRHFQEIGRKGGKSTQAKKTHRPGKA
jgi:general stress protein YciG